MKPFETTNLSVSHHCALVREAAQSRREHSRKPDIGEQVVKTDLTFRHLIIC